MSNPFTYYKTPKSKKEAQSNINYWWYVKMGGCPQGQIEANWKTYIKEMMRDAQKELSSFS